MSEDLNSLEDSELWAWQSLGLDAADPEQAPQSSSLFPAQPMTLSNLDQIRAIWPELESQAGAKILKQNPLRTVVYLPAEKGRPPLLIKKYNLRNRLEAWKYRFFPSRAKSEWLALRHLSSSCIPVPQVYAMGELREGSFLKQAGLIMEFLPNCNFLSDWVLDRRKEKGQEDRATSMLQECGRQIAKLHAAGCKHADLHCGNILVQSKDGVDKLFLIDHHVCKIGRVPSAGRRKRDIAKFSHSMLSALKASDLEIVLQAYVEEAPGSLGEHAAGTQAVGSKAVQAMLKDFLSRAQRLEKKRILSRAKRCWKNSSEFARTKKGRFHFFRRKEVPLKELEELVARQPAFSKVYKDRGWRKVGCIELAGQEVVLKVDDYKKLTKRLSAVFVQCPLSQAWAAARLFDIHHLPNPRSLALVLEKRWGLVRRAWLLCEHVDNADTLLGDLHKKYLDSEQPAARGELEGRIAGLARTLRQLHDTGIYHRDLNPQNLMVRSEEAGDRYWFVDLDSVRLTQGLNMRRRTKNLVQLALMPEGHVSAKHRLRFLREYCKLAPSGENQRQNGSLSPAYSREWIQQLDQDLAQECVSILAKMSLHERKQK